MEKDDSQTELGKHMQDLTLKNETIMWAQAQVPITIASFPTYDRCGIVHRPRECTIDDELVATMDENNFVVGRNNSYNQYLNNFNQGEGFMRKN